MVALKTTPSTAEKCFASDFWMISVGMAKGGGSGIAE